MQIDGALLYSQLHDTVGNNWMWQDTHRYIFKFVVFIERAVTELEPSDSVRPQHVVSATSPELQSPLPILWR
jgi:hypothetical protein